MQSEDGTRVLQFRPDGFTFNNLRTYLGGDRLISEGLLAWSRFASDAKPTVVTRIALRYINRLDDLTLRSGDEFRRFLTASPELPEGAPQTVSSFLAKIVAHDNDRNAVVSVTQQLHIQTQGGSASLGIPKLLIDVDAFKVGQFSVDEASLRSVIESLRQLKNETFFLLLTEEALRVYE